MTDSQIIVREFVEDFSWLHRHDPRLAYTTLISAFVACFGILSPPDRIRTITALHYMIKDIYEERFEDGEDLVSFLKEKIKQDRQDD